MDSSERRTIYLHTTSPKPPSARTQVPDQQNKLTKECPTPEVLRALQHPGNSRRQHTGNTHLGRPGIPRAEQKTRAHGSPPPQRCPSASSRLDIWSATGVRVAAPFLELLSALPLQGEDDLNTQLNSVESTLDVISDYVDA
jgi:hypothetical protein